MVDVGYRRVILLFCVWWNELVMQSALTHLYGPEPNDVRAQLILR